MFGQSKAQERGASFDPGRDLFPAVRRLRAPSAGGIVGAAEEPVPTFEVKQVTVPLFGVVEAPDQAAWLSSFAAAGATTQVQVDNAALNLIADELELDADGLAEDAERYVSGRYRVKARGMGGSRLGDLGEILTFLVNQVRGSEIVRVVSWRAGAGQAVKGSRFPQPDFIVRDANGSAAALEVKSTEAFDFIDLRDAPKKWTWLQPCSSVAGCREQALPQLAYVAGALTPQQHSLVVRAGTVVPFPVGKGVAAAVVAVDGRTEGLRSDPKFKTPKTCRDANRSCWSCIPSGCHFVLVTMPNAPGMLSLAGTAGERAANWLPAYRRWSQALAARDLLAVRESVGALSEAVSTWLASPDLPQPEVLRAFWGSYLHDAMRSRGLDVAVPGQLGNLTGPVFDFGWSPAPLAEPTNRESSIEEIARVIGDAQESLAPFTMSARLRGDDRAEGSLSVGLAGDFVGFRLASDTWWTAGAIENTDSASAVATRLLSAALEASGLPVTPDRGGFALREVVAQVGENTVRLGWESKPVTPRSTSWRSLLRYWPFWFEPEGWTWPPWPVLLALGDPRVRLRVRRDGRAELRVHKTLLRRW